MPRSSCQCDRTRKTLEHDRFCQCRLMFPMCVYSVPPRVLCLPGRLLWTATGAKCVKWSADFGLSVTSRLLDSLMKFLRAGRSVRLWINLDANAADYRRPISQTIASVLMRRRSLQLLSRLRRFWSFPGFCAVWTVDANSRMLQSNFIQSFWNFNDCFRTEFRFKPGRVLWSCCHHINNYCVRFSERQLGVR